MELIIIASAVILVFGAMIIAIAMSPGSARPASQSQPASEEVPAADSEASAAQPAEDQPAATQPATVQPAAPQPIVDQPVAAELAESQSAEISESPAAPLSPATTSSVSVAERDDASTLPLNPLQLKAAEIVSLQVDRLQAEYMRMGEERERLAQELLTSWLVERFEDAAAPLKADTRREAQDLRQQLARVSVEFERTQYRLTSLQNLQTRLDDPRIARQIDDLVNAVKHLARVR
jgi:hypothetical protein